MAGRFGRAFASAFGVLTLIVAGGCTQNAQTVTLRSLESSGTFSFVCLGADYGARDIDDCPDTNPVDGEDRHLITLVTQATRGEVALVDLTTGKVVDDEPTIPGFNFLPVGGAPIAIVSTPGSVATFVGVGEVGKEGIYALPTSCLAPRGPNEPLRDLTVWPACSLPSAPGEMTVLIDHPVDGDGDPATPPASRCVSSFPTATSEEIESRQCPADLSLETKNPGRRLLAVALPASGEIAIIDAQALLDRPQGSFDPCPIETISKLRVDIPADPPQQVVPPDLKLPGATPPVGHIYEQVEGYEPKPAGGALVDDPRTGEELLYITDQSAPVIHVIDAKNPCALVEKAPLLPMSFNDPTRTVTTKRVAVSPLTSAAKRYLYAIDDNAENADVMIFDVSPGATDRTPLLRPRSALMPQEPPDRIRFPNVAAKDVTFALRDRVEVDPVTGSGQVGIFCSPDPGIDRNSPPARYRPNADLSAGAAPTLLRGVFGFVALSSGTVGIIDVEDFDAQCRRPVVPNSAPDPNFRGCSGDQSNIAYYTLNPDSPQPPYTVSNEQSCNVVEPHRVRSALFVLNDLDVGSTSAPSLRELPRLVSDVGRTSATDASEEGRNNPKMLGVNFSPEDPAQVYVGTTLHEPDSLDSPLIIDPTKAEENSLVLDMTEPRSYPTVEQFAATYEGTLFDERPSADFQLEGGQASLVDSGFCDSGVEDGDIATSRGRALGVPEGDALATFSRTHADYIRITSDLLDEADVYWSRAGARCGNASPDLPGSGFLECRAHFGTRKAMRTEREFTITQASRNTLVLTPRLDDPTLSAFAECCFPQLVSYEVRASNTWVVRGSVSRYRHDIKTGPDPFRCEIDTDPLRSQFRGRVYEVSCDQESTECATQGVDDEGNPISTPKTNVGLALPDDIACKVQSPTEISNVDDSPCVFVGLTSRFVIYRGQSPSRRDWSFSWEVNSGFAPLFVNLAVSSDPNSNPQSMVFNKQLGELVIADGASKGLVTIDLSTFQSQFFF